MKRENQAKRLIITGGGTGGHVFPALEVALEAKNQGWEVQYFGSNQGQERPLCEKNSLNFIGFSTTPFYKLQSYRGVRARAQFLRAYFDAFHAIKRFDPSVLFSTGGYSSAPVVSAAKHCRIPYVLHEQNAVPGRTNRIHSKKAHSILTVFEGTSSYFSKEKTTRVGMPIRKYLRECAYRCYSNPSEKKIEDRMPLILVIGGSQGAASLNDAVLATAVRMAKHKLRWLHLTGPAHFEETQYTLEKLGIESEYRIKAFLEVKEIAAAYEEASLVICRSGASTLAELAAFRKLAIYVPYPHAVGHHQLMNAREFEELGAGFILEQKNLNPVSLEDCIVRMLTNLHQRQIAKESLAIWDIENPVEKVLLKIEEAANFKP